MITNPLPAPRGTARAWVENFDGAAGNAPDPTLLQYRFGGNGWGNQELETYTTHHANAALDGRGHLEINALRQKLTGADGLTREWTSARLDSLGKWAFTSGTIAIRMKMPSAPGLWPAFWLEGADLPSVGWPKAGEIDVMEAPAGHQAVFQSVHGPNGTPAGYSYTAKTAVPAGQSIDDAFHIFSVTRNANRIEFGIDGKLSGTITPKMLKKSELWVYDKPMFLIVNLAVGGFWPTPPTAETPAKSTVVIDWIRYEPEGAQQ